MTPERLEQRMRKIVQRSGVDDNSVPAGLRGFVNLVGEYAASHTRSEGALRPQDFAVLAEADEGALNREQTTRVPILPYIVAGVTEGSDELRPYNAHAELAHMPHRIELVSKGPVKVTMFGRYGLPTPDAMRHLRHATQKHGQELQMLYNIIRASIGPHEFGLPGRRGADHYINAMFALYPTARIELRTADNMGLKAHNQRSYTLGDAVLDEGINRIVHAANTHLIRPEHDGIPDGNTMERPAVPWYFLRKGGDEFQLLSVHLEDDISGDAFTKELVRASRGPIIRHIVNRKGHEERAVVYPEMMIGTGLIRSPSQIGQAFSEAEISQDKYKQQQQARFARNNPGYILGSDGRFDYPQ